MWKKGKSRGCIENGLEAKPLQLEESMYATPTQSVCIFKHKKLSFSLNIEEH